MTSYTTVYKMYNEANSSHDYIIVYYVIIIILFLTKNSDYHSDKINMIMTKHMYVSYKIRSWE